MMTESSRPMESTTIACADICDGVGSTEVNGAGNLQAEQAKGQGRGFGDEPVGRLRACSGFSLTSATCFDSPHELELSGGFCTILSLTVSLLFSFELSPTTFTDDSGALSSSVASSNTTLQTLQTQTEQSR